jgi:ABC-type siderophore export system fused ATPase/permease subunit
LLDEFEKQMELDRFNLKPSELAIYKPFYDAVQVQSELDKTKRELEDTKYELKTEREANSDLNKQLVTKQDESLRAEIQHLQSIYKPSTRKYASIGLAIVLSGALGVMTQMAKVSGILEKYSPFGKQYISLGLFICLLFFLVAMLRKLWEREYIKRKSEEVCSPKYADEFMAISQAQKVIGCSDS